MIAKVGMFWTTVLGASLSLIIALVVLQQRDEEHQSPLAEAKKEKTPRKLGLDLKVVAALTKAAKDPQDLETTLNSDKGFHNLDLDDNGLVDYIGLTEWEKDGARGFTFKVDVAGKGPVAIAELKLEQDSRHDKVNLDLKTLDLGVTDHLQGVWAQAKQIPIVLYLFAKPHEPYLSSMWQTPVKERKVVTEKEFVASVAKSPEVMKSGVLKTKKPRKKTRLAREEIKRRMQRGSKPIPPGREGLAPQVAKPKRQRTQESYGMRKYGNKTLRPVGKRPKLHKPQPKHPEQKVLPAH